MPGCGAPHYGKGFCRLHYDRVRREHLAEKMAHDELCEHLGHLLRAERKLAAIQAVGSEDDGQTHFDPEAEAAARAIPKRERPIPEGERFAFIGGEGEAAQVGPDWAKPIVLTADSATPDLGGRLRWDLLPFDALDPLVVVLGHGAEKHSPEGWRERPIEEHRAAFLGHVFAWAAGRGPDQETGESHLAHALTRGLFVLALEADKEER